MTPIDLDEDAVARAMAELGTTKKDAINQALPEVAARCTGLHAFEKLVQLGDAEAGYHTWRERTDAHAAHTRRETAA